MLEGFSTNSEFWQLIKFSLIKRNRTLHSETEITGNHIMLGTLSLMQNYL